MKYFVFKYMWLIAILPKTIQFFVLGIVMVLGHCINYRHEQIKLDFFSRIVLVTNIIFTFAILTSLLRGEHDFVRVLAAINTCGITYISIGYYFLYSSQKIDLMKISRYMFINMLILLVVFGLYKCVGTKGNFNFMNGALCGPDWINGKYELRFRAYLEYTNLVIYMYLYAFPLSLIYIQKKFGNVVCIAYELVLLIPIIETNSRAGIPCAIFLVLLTCLLINIKRILNIYNNNKRFVIGSLLIIGLLMVMLGNQLVIKVINKILAARQGSTSTRMQIYTASWNRMIQQSPLFGCGVKDMFGGFPYGSHSTYIGMFYKTGIIGGSIYILGIVWHSIRLSFTKKTNEYAILIKMSYLCVLALSVFEDLDGSNWNLVIFMSVVAVCFTKKNCIDEMREG